jgi:hypothetical protein
VSMSDALYGALTGGKSKDTEGFSRFLGEMKASHGGSRRAAARAAGVSESTWRAWEKGTVPKSANNERIMRAGRENRLVSDGPTDRTVKITSTDRGTTKDRTITAEKLAIRPGTMDAVREALVKGDSQGMVGAFTDGVGNQFYKGYLSKGAEKDAAEEARRGAVPRKSPHGLPDRPTVSGGSIRADGSESQGSLLEERQDEGIEHGMVAAGQTPDDEGAGDELVFDETAGEFDPDPGDLAYEGYDTSDDDSYPAAGGVGVSS